MKVVLFAGAGVSAELGVPAMRSMAEGFLAHLRDNGYPLETLSSLERLLAAADFDMENVIDDLDSAGRGAAATARWGVASAPDVGQFSTLRAEAEWLIAHLCERVDQDASYWLWHSVLSRVAPDSLTLASTNYDRAIEQAALRLQVPIGDGFQAFGGTELVSWVGFDEEVRLRLLKIHGSTDWYHGPGDAGVWKLRHAMPLYGAVRIAIAGSELSLGSALVLPSREKKVTSPPYPELAFEFRKAVDAADLVIFVGSSLRDPDLLDLVARSAARRPTLVVGRSGRSDAPGERITMSASRFLVSVAPRILTAPTAEAAVEFARLASGWTGSILVPYATAMSEASSPEARCAAIELLAADRVSLPADQVGDLLRSGNASVRTFALGLVGDCHDPAGARAIALERAREEVGSPFAREAALLEDPSSL
jgi:hypothetical protein